MSIAMCQKELFDKLRQLDSSIIVDGVPDEAQYIAAPYRIMYVLKEVNGGSGWSLCDHLQSGGRGREHDPTWDNIARCFIHRDEIRISEEPRSRNCLRMRFYLLAFQEEVWQKDRDMSA